jgi:hypothetical protein
MRSSFLANSALMPHAALAGVSAARGISTCFCGMQLKMEDSLTPLKARGAPEIWQAGPWPFDTRSKPTGRDCRLPISENDGSAGGAAFAVFNQKSKIINLSFVAPRRSRIVNPTISPTKPTPGRLRSPPHASNLIAPFRKSAVITSPSLNFPSRISNDRWSSR